MTTTRCYLLFALVAAISFSGCAVKNSMRLSGKNSQWNPLAKLTESNDAKKADDEKATPESMAVIWKDSVLEKPGTPAVRGFGGRIFFYDQDSNAIQADGELVVYGFDESKETNGESAKPDRKYVFKQDKFHSHFSETDLGSSYSVWIPWEKVGGLRKTITLIPIFKTADGNVLKSGQSIHVLPGKNPHSETQLGAKPKRGLNRSTVATASYDSDAGESESDTIALAAMESDDINRTRIRTSTIKLTPSLAKRMSGPLDSASKAPTQSPDSEVELRNSRERGGEEMVSRFRRSRSKVQDVDSKTEIGDEESTKVNSEATQKRAYGSPGPWN